VPAASTTPEALINVQFCLVHQGFEVSVPRYSDSSIFDHRLMFGMRAVFGRVRKCAVIVTHVRTIGRCARHPGCCPAAPIDAVSHRSQRDSQPLDLEGPMSTGRNGFGITMSA
jgi:hypothetical protein